MLSKVIFTFERRAENVAKFIKNNVSKCSVFLKAANFCVAFSLLMVMPGMLKNHAPDPVYKTDLRLNPISQNPLTLKDRTVQITTGTSKIDEARLIQFRSVPAQNVERDPSYFIPLYMRAASAYGLPWQLLQAVHYVETGCSDSTYESSSAGAQGPMQFMPGTWRAYGVDGNGDGSKDINNVEDAVFGAANLLAAGGAADGNIDQALLNYNHAQWYVIKVKDIAYAAGMLQ